MTRIAGASQYLNQATLSNKQGVAPVSTNVLSQSAGGISLLDVARSSAPNNGIGLSSSARALNSQFLENNSSTVNQLFSLTGGSSATIESAQIQIRALQSSVPVSRETPEVRGAKVDKSA
tara:strand:- start:13352 stop:13711 length:360 start_codon:yes stop_codon:yes gene_type:complete